MRGSGAWDTGLRQGVRLPCPEGVLWQPQTVDMRPCVRILAKGAHTHSLMQITLQPKRNQNQTNQVAIFIHKIEEPKKEAAAVSVAALPAPLLPITQKLKARAFGALVLMYLKVKSPIHVSVPCRSGANFKLLFARPRGQPGASASVSASASAGFAACSIKRIKSRAGICTTPHPKTPKKKNKNNNSRRKRGAQP